jgi:16S rRNA (cytidine1402-2'-O)-methyltransferase
MNKGSLTVIGNHIGNRVDIHSRLPKLIEETSEILCEHRETFLLDLEYSNIKTKKNILVYSEFNSELEANNTVIDKLLSGKNILFILENGMLGFADPGIRLVDDCYKNKINVNVIPGPSIVSTLPSIAGIPQVGTGWTFEEIFSIDQDYIFKKIDDLKDIRHNIIILNRSNTATILSNMLSIFKEDRLAAVCIDIGLEGQKVIRDTLSNLIKNYEVNNIKQELTSIVCSGNSFL